MEDRDLQRRRSIRRKKRISTQPLNMPNAGSVFRNPENMYAGELIEKSNLKGLNHLQKSFVSLISDRIRDVIKDADFKNETRCYETRCRDLDKIDYMLDDLIDDLFKRLEKRR